MTLLMWCILVLFAGAAGYLAGRQEGFAEGRAEGLTVGIALGRRALKGDLP